MARTMTTAVGTGAALVALAAMAAPLAAQDAVTEWSGEMAAGRTLRVQGISGEIVATAAAGSRAEVVATKRGDEDDFDAVHVVVEEEGDGIRVCAVYRVRDPERCDYDDDDRDDRWRHRNIDVSVDFEVRVPAGVDFEGTVVSGEVRARDLRSDVRARSVSGDIFVSTTGVGWGKTVSGDIEIAMGSTDFGDLDFTTVSGDIVLTLPAGVAADVAFQSLSGDFESDLPLEVTSQRGGFVGSRLEGRLGSGGPRLAFKTVSGDVRLRQAR